MASAVDSGADGVVLFRFGTMNAQHWEQAQLGLASRSKVYYWAVGVGAFITISGVALYALARRKRKTLEVAREKERRRKPARRR